LVKIAFFKRTHCVQIVKTVSNSSNLTNWLVFFFAWDCVSCINNYSVFVFKIFETVLLSQPYLLESWSMVRLGFACFCWHISCLNFKVNCIHLFHDHSISLFILYIDNNSNEGYETMMVTKTTMVMKATTVMKTMKQ
jgi:hypothetical protein